MTQPETQIAQTHRPPDAEAFVAEAQRVTNEADLAALDGLYATSAVFELTGDGIYERHVGGTHCTDAWKAMLAGTAGRLRIEKSLVATTDDRIVNDWIGRVGRQTTRGVELWRFDRAGKVVHHQIFQTVAARDSRELGARVRAALNHPLLAWRLLRARWRYGGAPNG